MSQLKDTPDEQKFISRDAVERTILFPIGGMVDLEGSWRGNQRLECKRWNTRKAFQCGELVGDILAALFPNDMLFLVQLQWDKPLTASHELYEVIFNRIYDPMVKLVCLTLDITDDVDIREFIETTVPMDIVELFVTIVNQEMNNTAVEAIIKKAQRLLVEKFRLDSDSWSLQNVLGALLQIQSTDTPQSSLQSSPIMPT